MDPNCQNRITLSQRTFQSIDESLIYAWGCFQITFTYKHGVRHRTVLQKGSGSELLNTQHSDHTRQVKGNVEDKRLKGKSVYLASQNSPILF